VSNFIPPFIAEAFQDGKTTGTVEAATLFVDISGFTRLTERLMEHQKDGAEILANALETIFDPLAQHVQSNGGIIPLFAGDAFIALFPASETDPMQEAATNAADSALFVRDHIDSLQSTGDLKTKYGDFSVGMKLGLAHGSVEWAIVNDTPPHTFYFRGSGIQNSIKAEAIAAAGEIIVDSETVPFIASTSPSTTRLSEDYLRLEDITRSGRRSLRSIPIVPVNHLRPFVSHQLLESSIRGEFRTICPIFISFDQDLPAEDVARFTQEAITTAHLYGGHFHQIEFGDKGGIYIILFGAPIAHERSVHRAAEFLLSMKTRCQSVHWRSGMTYGIAWTGIRGGTNRCEYAAIGDVMNLAARLAERVPSNGIWINESVARVLDDSYHLSSVGTLHIKGKTRETSVFTLSCTKKARCSARMERPCIGRDQELNTIQELLDPIFQGKFAGNIRIHGEAGVGKSFMVDEFRCRLTSERDLHWFTCHTDPILKQSLHPFSQLVRSILGMPSEHAFENPESAFSTALDSMIDRLNRSGENDTLSLAEELARTRSFLAAILGIHWKNSLYAQLDPRLRMENIQSALKALVKATSTAKPLVLQIEDAQWLDEDSRALLRVLMRNVESYPMAILCLYRYNDDGSLCMLNLDEYVPQRDIELNRLDMDTTAILAGDCLHGPVSNKLLDFLEKKTEGNPFFVEQLLMDMKERGILVQDTHNEWTFTVANEHIPSQIVSVLVARLDRLTAELKEVVQTASVLGNEFELHVLSQMIRNDPSLWGQVHEAEHQRIWHALSDIKYIFHHALMRDAAYEMQLKPRLRILHHLAAESMERSYKSNPAPHYADLAYHWGMADVTEKEREYSKKAAEYAANRHDMEQAIIYFDRALELTPESDTEDLFELLFGHENVASLRGLRDRQKDDLSQLINLADTLGDSGKLAEIEVRRAHFAEAIGDFPEAIKAAQCAVEHARTGGDEENEAAGYRLWGGVLMRQGNYEEAGDRLMRALSHARSTGAATEESTVLLNLGTLARRRGDYKEAVSFFEHALLIARNTGNTAAEGSILNNLGSVSYHAGDLISARHYFNESLGICRKIGYRMAECNALGNIATIAADLGDYNAARRDHEEALHTRREIGDRQGESLTLNNMGKNFMDIGDFETARHHLEHTLKISRTIGVPIIEGVALVNLSTLHHRLEDHISSLEYGNAALEIARRLGDDRMIGYAQEGRGQALTALCRYQAAVDAFQESIETRTDHPVLENESRCGLARALFESGKTADALRHLDTVLENLKEYGTAGSSDPFGIYWNCFFILEAVTDPRATRILDDAYSQLSHRAERIRDAAIRRSFLENVTHHRAIVEAHESE